MNHQGKDKTKVCDSNIWDGPWKLDGEMLPQYFDMKPKKKTKFKKCLCSFVCNFSHYI